MRAADSQMSERFPGRDGSPAEGSNTRFGELPSGVLRLGIALAAFAGALGSTLFLKRVGVECVDTVFLIAIVAVGIRCGLWPALGCAFVSALAYNFFFVPPGHTFTLGRPDNILVLTVFLLAAVVASHLAARIRAEARAAQRCAEVAEALFEFSRQIAQVTELDHLLQATVHRIGTMLDSEAALLLPDATGKLTVRASTPSWREVDVSHADDPGAHHASDARFVTLQSAVGRVEIAPRRFRGGGAKGHLSGEDQKILDALLSQAAVAIERIRCGRERDDARLAAETERLRTALLTGLSHDLKTPLASILGAITALRQHGDLYDAAARDELESMIHDEAERLGRFVANLLHMTRMEAGAIVPERQPVDVGEVIGTAVRHAASVLSRNGQGRGRPGPPPARPGCRPAGACLIEPARQCR